MVLVTQVCDQVRTLFRIRRERSTSRAGQKPGVGARIACGDLRMTVQAGMSDALWRWLTNQGWREVLYRPDRRRYRDVPHGYVTQLIDAHPDHRERILSLAKAHAAFRPQRPRTLGFPGRSDVA